MKSIRVDRLQNKTSAGLQIKAFDVDARQQSSTENSGAHRDDHYIFFLLTKGSGTLTVDMQNITVAAGELYYILPSQVHHKIKTDRAAGWFLAVDTSLILPDIKDAFENRLNVQIPCKLSGHELKQYKSLLGVLRNEFVERPGNKYYLSIIHTLVQSFLAMAAATCSMAADTENKHGRSAEITRGFKNLLAVHIQTIKSPSVYASKLNVSPGYLNEAVKQATGSTVSSWIQQEVFSEAKRLLYHTETDVKQIAQELGYTDHSYFIRSFKKLSGLSPLKFRALNRDNG